MNIKNIIFNNFSLKIFSLFLAIAFWTMIAGKARSSIEKFINIDVEFINILKNANIYANPDKVRIKVKGTTNEIKLITKEDFAVKIDLANVRDGVRNYYTRDFLITEKNDFIASVHPTMIEVNVREIVRKSVPVKVRFIKTVRNKKRYYRPERISEIGYVHQLNPERVTIEGYRTNIKDISYVTIDEEIVLPDSSEAEVHKIVLKKPKGVLRFFGTNEIELSVNLKKTNEKDSKDSKNEGKTVKQKK